MKKLLAMALAATMGLGLMTGCSSNTSTPKETEAPGTTAAQTEAATEAPATEAPTTEAQTEAASHYPVTISTYNFAKEPVEVTFESCPTRVVTTNQTQTELLLYFGLDEYIVGTAYLDGDIREDLQAQYNALKDAGKELTVTGYPSKETVLSLEPDFIFGWRSAFAEDQLGDVSEWTEIGVGTMILRCSNNTCEVRDINAVLDDVRDIGKIFDIEDKTDAYIAEAEAMLKGVQDKVATLSEDEIKTAVLLEPMGEGQYYAWPVSSLSGALLEAAGAKNIVEEGATLSAEDVIALNPDVIVLDYMCASISDDPAANAAAIEALTSEAAFAELTAVTTGKVMACNLTDIYGGGIRMIPSVEAMFKFIYGE